METIAIIGIGKWGKNLLREFNTIADIKYAQSTGNIENVQWLKQHYPHIQHTSSLSIILKDPSIKAVVIATPIKTHYKIAIQALKAYKHVFIEKPLTDRVRDAQALVKLAQKNRSTLFVGHLFLYHPIFQKIQKIHKNDPIVSIHSEWHKQGSFQEDVVWNLLVHDVALLIALWGDPRSARLYYRKGIISAADIVATEFTFSKNKKAHVFINRVSNIKRKAITLVTAKNNIYLWENDTLLRLNPTTKIFQPIMQSKKTTLALECRAFLKTVRQRSVDTIGLDVVRALSTLK